MCLHPANYVNTNRRIASRNQISLAALQTSQEMLQPMLRNELTKIKQSINEQLSNAVEKVGYITIAKLAEYQRPLASSI
jgi:hypothetical protein